MKLTTALILPLTVTVLWAVVLANKPAQEVHTGALTREEIKDTIKDKKDKGYDDDIEDKCWMVYKKCCKIPRYQERCHKVVKYWPATCFRTAFKLKTFPCGFEDGRFKHDSKNGDRFDGKRDGDYDGKFEGKHDDRFRGKEDEESGYENKSDSKDGFHHQHGNNKVCVKKIPYRQAYDCERPYYEEHCGHVLCKEFRTKNEYKWKW